MWQGLLIGKQRAFSDIIVLVRPVIRVTETNFSSHEARRS